MLTIESILHSSPILNQLRTIVDMSTTIPDKSNRRRRALPDSGAATPKRRRRIRQPLYPEKDSIYDIMHTHSGTPLFVLPICWTDLHVRLLGAKFVASDPITTPVPTPHNSRPTSSEFLPHAAISLQRELSTLLSSDTSRPFCKARAIKYVLWNFWPTTMSKPRTAAELDVYFGDRVYRKGVRIPIMWKYPDCPSTSFDSATTRPSTSFVRKLSSQASNGSGSGWSSNSSQPTPCQPMLAYMSRTQLAFVRQNLFRIMPGPKGGDESNRPVSRLQQLRSKMLLPKEADHDAHFLGVLIAMAQAHFYADASPSSSRSASQTSSRSGSRNAINYMPNLRDVKVQLLTNTEDVHDGGTAEFIVYTAVVSAAFLHRFADPTGAPLDDNGLTVEYTRVPVWPVLGLKERLGKALGRDIAGEPYDDEAGGDLETWESEEERQARLRTLKRRRMGRTALSEVLNRSFEMEEGTEAEPPLSPHAKRRCTKPDPSVQVC